MVGSRQTALEPDESGERSFELMLFGCRAEFGVLVLRSCLFRRPGCPAFACGEVEFAKAGAGVPAEILAKLVFRPSR